MKVRRIRTPSGLQTQRCADGGWVPIDGQPPFGPSPFSDDWQRATADRHLRHTDCLLPFDPLSLRDFLLCEQHNIDASRGLVERFHPRTSRLARAFEATTRRPFPPFKPNRLFYEQPIYHFANATTIVPSRTPIACPSYSAALDFELELAWVLKAPLYDASPDEAVEAIDGFALFNDFSARDVQRAEMASGFGPQKSKHFVSSMSPTAVTADEVLARLDQLTGSVAINGRAVSTVTSHGLQWRVGKVLAHVSRDERLLPGEVSASGTLAGGSGTETGNWLRPGDTLKLVLDDIGEVAHRIVQGGPRCRRS